MRRDKKGVMVTNANVKVFGVRDGLQSTCGREYKREREGERERMESFAPLCRYVAFRKR